MKIIDLSQSLYDGMDVYPGDPEVKIKQIHTLKKEGWRLRLMELSSHAGTHVDAFAHMDEKGQTIDKIPLGKFIGNAQLVSIEDDFPSQVGLVFRFGELEFNHFSKLKKSNPPFVVVGNEASISVELERELLKNEIITFTDLINLDKLPRGKIFTFYGVPLNIKNGDGSPIRAFVVLQ